MYTPWGQSHETETCQGVINMGNKLDTFGLWFAADPNIDSILKKLTLSK